MVALLAARNSVAVDSSFRSLSAFLTARHSVAVDCSCPPLSFYVIALLAGRHSVRVLSIVHVFYVVAELAVVKTYHYDFLPVIETEVIRNYLYRDLYIQRSSYIICISAYKCLYA